MQLKLRVSYLFSNRKPYLDLGMSLKDFFSAPVRYLKGSVTKESQFEKPYLQKEYRKMHFDIPAPKWDKANFDLEKRKKRKFTPAGGGKIDCEAKDCRLYGDGIHPNWCADTPISIWPAIWCSWDTASYSDCRMKVVALEGEILSERIHWMGPPGVEVFLNPAIAHHVIQGTLIDGVGHVCIVTVEQDCVECKCPAETTFAFDNANTPDTIAKNSSIEVYVTGGCPPFKYRTASTGYRFEQGFNFETTARNATLSCFDGVGGVDFDLACTITITDACDNVVTACIKNTSTDGIFCTAGTMTTNACDADPSTTTAYAIVGTYCNAADALAALTSWCAGGCCVSGICNPCGSCTGVTCTTGACVGGEKFDPDRWNSYRGYKLISGHAYTLNFYLYPNL